MSAESLLNDQGFKTLRNKVTRSRPKAFFQLFVGITTFLQFRGDNFSAIHVSTGLTPMGTRVRGNTQQLNGSSPDDNASDGSDRDDNDDGHGGYYFPLDHTQEDPQQLRQAQLLPE